MNIGEKIKNVFKKPEEIKKPTIEEIPTEEVKERLETKKREYLKEVFDRLNWAELFDDEEKEGGLFKLLPIINLIIGIFILVLLIKK